MPFFGNFGSKKKSKSSLTLTDGGSDPGWGGGHSGGGFNTFQNSSSAGENQDKRMINKLERINNDLEDKNEQLEEENNMLKLKVCMHELFLFSTYEANHPIAKNSNIGCFIQIIFAFKCDSF